MLEILVAIYLLNGNTVLNTFVDLKWFNQIPSPSVIMLDGTRKIRAPSPFTILHVQ